MQPRNYSKASRDRVAFAISTSADVRRAITRDDRFPPPLNPFSESRGYLDRARKSSWTRILKGYDVSDPAWAVTSHSHSLPLRLALTYPWRVRSWSGGLGWLAKPRGSCRLAILSMQQRSFLSPTSPLRVDFPPIPIPEFSEGRRACSGILIARRTIVGRGRRIFVRSKKSEELERDACRVEVDGHPRSHRELPL